MDEKQAIVQLRRGNLDGLETLVSIYQLQALRTASLITGDPAQAEDIVQNAFIRAAGKIAQFDERQPFGAWFMRSVIHDALKVLARQKRSVSLEAGEENENFDLLDPALLPEEAVERQETRQAIWRALEKLAPKQRAAVVMRYYLQMHEEEIARVLNGAPGTVKWWLFVARQQLAKSLRPIRSAEINPEVPVQPHQPESGGQR